uniref:DUF5581 domain-containing protein n=1 Tax=Echeneis naucrates TaxID=173247 RepID=A0A665SVW9_ECHNA
LGNGQRGLGLGHLQRGLWRNIIIWSDLLLMQRGSYYLEIQCEVVLDLSDDTLWSMIDQQRLHAAKAMAKTQVQLLLIYLEMLYQEILKDCRELQAFVEKHSQGLVDAHTAASIQQRLQQTHQDLKDFERRLTKSLGPLNLQNPLIRDVGNILYPEISALLVIKMPVIFDRCRSHASLTSTSVYLCWEVAGQHFMEPDEQFEICIKSLRPNADDNMDVMKYVCESHYIYVNQLISDRHYEFSVKRIDTTKLVYGVWTDTIILKTMNISSHQAHESEEREREELTATVFNLNY